MKFRQCMGIEHDSDNQIDEDMDCESNMTERAAFRASHLAVAQDGSGYLAALKCREDFGCLLFKEKP